MFERLIVPVTPLRATSLPLELVGAPVAYAVQPATAGLRHHFLEMLPTLPQIDHLPGVARAWLTGVVL